MLRSTTTVHGIHVFSNDTNIQKQLTAIIEAPKFLKYISNLDKNLLDITELRIDAVKWFCNPIQPDPAKLGFLYMELSATDKRNQKPVPGCIFLRGDAVAVYIRLDVEGTKYVLLTRQLRAPIGGLLDEIPGGMMDEHNCFASVALKEIQEETGLVAPSSDCLVELGPPIIPSGGGCDEEIQMYFWETSVTAERFNQMKNKIFGSVEENESIQLVFIPADEYENHLMTNMRDATSICAHLRASKMGLLNSITK